MRTIQGVTTTSAPRSAAATAPSRARGRLSRGYERDGQHDEYDDQRAVTASQGGGTAECAREDPAPGRRPLDGAQDGEQRQDDEWYVDRLGHDRRVDSDERRRHGRERGGSETHRRAPDPPAQLADQRHRHRSDCAPGELIRGAGPADRLGDRREEDGIQRRPECGRDDDAVPVELGRVDYTLAVGDGPRHQLVPHRIETEMQVSAEGEDVDHAQRKAGHADRGQRPTNIEPCDAHPQGVGPGGAPMPAATRMPLRTALSM